MRLGRARLALLSLAVNAVVALRHVRTRVADAAVKNIATRVGIAASALAKPVVVGAAARLLLAARLGLEALQGRDRLGEAFGKRGHRDLLPSELLDIAQIGALVVGAEADCDPVGTRPRGPADAVDILLGDVGKVVVDHVADARDVDPASGDVGRDEDRHFARAECGKRLFALRLALVAVDRTGRNPGRVKLADDLVGAVLGPAEDECTFDLGGLEEQRQKRGLFRLVDEGNLLFDPLDGGRDGGHRDLCRVGEIGVGERPDVLGHGGREEQGLALGRDQLHDPLQRMDEAQVEHLIGLVEDEDFQFREIDRALLDKVEQAAGGRHQHVETARNGAHALVGSGPAEDHSDTGAQLLAIGLGACGDLRGELTGRGENEHSDLLRLGNAPGGMKPLERRKHEGGGLAGPGLGNSEQIAPGQHGRDGLRLDRSGNGVALGFERVGERLDQAEIVERHKKYP